MKINARIIVLFLLPVIVVITKSLSKQTVTIDDKSSIYSSRGKNVPFKKIKNKAGVIASLTLQTNYTVVFEEDFENLNSFPPKGWTTQNVDGGGITGPWFQGNTSIFPAYNGSGYAAANYQGANDFYIDEWLISPRILSVSLEDTLIFWQRSPDYSAWDDSIEVRISTTDTALASFNILVDYFKTSTTEWQQKKYPLNNYVTSGSNIYIAFRYLIYNGGISGLSSDYVGIDLVQIVRPQVGSDIKVVSVDYPFKDTKILNGENINPIVTIANVGHDSQYNIPIVLNIISPVGFIHTDTTLIQSLDPGQNIQIAFKDYLLTTPGEHHLIVFSKLSTDQNRTNDTLGINFRSSVLISGLFTVGIDGMVKSLKNVVDTLNNNIISDEVIFTLIDTDYNEPPLSIGPLDYLFSVRRVLIKPATGVSPVMHISSTPIEPFGIAIMGSSKIEIDGSNGIDNQSMTINLVNENGKIGILVRGVEGSFADSNNIKNLKIQTGADSTLNSDGYYGILLFGYDEINHNSGNQILNCDIQKFGSAGIASQWEDGLIIDGNFIHDWHKTGGYNDIHGILLADGSRNAVVRNNIIGDIKTSVNYVWAYGIENSAGFASNALFYNNMIYKIASIGRGTYPNLSRAIYSSSMLNNGDRYFFNSIFISGIDSSFHELSRSAGFEFVGGTNIQLKNNIVVNEMSCLGTSEENKAYCIYLSSIPISFVSDYNDFYAPGLQGVIGYNSGNRVTLLEWGSSFTPTMDIKSISVDPMFISPNDGNLHIQPTVTSLVNAAGIPIDEVCCDIDGMPRNPLTPDIGADEFIPGASTITVSYSSGWNLVSVPMVVENYLKRFIFPTAISEAFYYNNGYTLTSQLTNGIGYWLKFNSPQKIEIAGIPIHVDTIDIVKGWNLIGSISDTILTTSVVQYPEGIIISDYYSYDEGYKPTNIIIPGRSYWIKSREEGKIILKKN